MNIFEILEKNKIVYSVAVSYQWMLSNPGRRAKKYHLLLSSVTEEKARKTGLNVSKSTLFKDLREKTLNKSQIVAFRKLVSEEKLVKAYQDDDGIVYELPRKSFRTHFRSIIPKVRSRKLVVGTKDVAI